MPRIPVVWVDPTVNQSGQVAHGWVEYMGWLAAKQVVSEVLMLECGWITMGALAPAQTVTGKKSESGIH